MRFTPCSEEEALGLLPPGIYKFIVKRAQDKISAAGNEYIAMVLSIYDAGGRERSVFTNMSLPYLVKHFCESTGMPEKWDTGIVCAKDCESRSGHCKLFTKIDKSGAYPPKTDVADFVMAEVPKATVAEEKPFVDSELPF